MITELEKILGFYQYLSSPYYPLANGKVEAVHKSLKTMLQRTMNKHRPNWHIMIYASLQNYRTSITTIFSPFHLVHGVESLLPIECEIPSLKIVVELLPDTRELENRLLYLELLDEHRRDSLNSIEVNKKCVQNQYDYLVHPHIFSKGDLVLVYDQKHDELGLGNSLLCGLVCK